MFKAPFLRWEACYMWGLIAAQKESQDLVTMYVLVFNAEESEREHILQSKWWN